MPQSPHNVNTVEELIEALETEVCRAEAEAKCERDFIEMKKSTNWFAQLFFPFSSRLMPAKVDQPIVTH